MHLPSRARPFAAAIVAVLVTTFGAVSPAAAAPRLPIPSYAPAGWTAHMADDGNTATTEQQTDAVEVGNNLITAGFIPKAQNPTRTTTITCGHLLVLNESTGATSCPVRFNGATEALWTIGNFLYVGGRFTSVTDGAGSFAVRNLVKIDLATLRVVRTFNAQLNSGGVTDLKDTHGHLIVAGTFSKVGSATRVGLASVSPVNGALTAYANLNINGTVASNAGGVGVSRIAISPLGNRAFAIGNFKSIGGQTRWRGAMLLLETSMTVSGWSASMLDDLCSTRIPDYLRDVDFSEDGTRFALVATGGQATYPKVCDAVTEWTVRDSASTPNWYNYTPKDTLLSVQYAGIGGSTATAIYAGGHQKGHNTLVYRGGRKISATPVAAAGLGAINASTGLAHNWAAGKQRLIGAKLLKVMPANANHGLGLLVGSDAYRFYRGDWKTACYISTDSRWMDKPCNWAGGYYRGGIAFLPLP